MIRQITAETGTEINIEDDGTIQIAATSGEAAQKAIAWIEGLTKDVEVGKEYMGKVTRIMNFGAFVEILPGKEGLVHISQLADYRVPRVEDVVSIGDELMVVVTEIDRMGRVNLSRRAAMERHMAKAGVPAAETATLGHQTERRRGDAAAASRSGGRRHAGPMGAETLLTAVAERGPRLHALPAGSVTRTSAVPGEGNPSRDVLLVGEGPGAREDATGPAVRRPGRPAARTSCCARWAGRARTCSSPMS